MSQKNQHPASKTRRLGHGKMVFMLACLAIPAVFYLATGHPAFMVVLLSGMIGISVTSARLSRK
jgi:hypothetical protein